MGYFAPPTGLSLALSLGVPCVVNGSLTASVATNAMTLALKGFDGNDPSATNPVYLITRNATLTTGPPSVLAITASLSVVIPSSATLGTTNNNTSHVWAVLFNDGGTPRIGVVNCFGGNGDFLFLQNELRNSTTIGAGATSVQTIYTDSGVSLKPFAPFGYVESTQTTAGTWAASPTTISTWRPGMPLPGHIIQTRLNFTGAVSTGTTVIPFDDTVPQNTEGDQYMTQAITPSSAANVLSITAIFFGSQSSPADISQCALFQDSTAGALAVSGASDGTNGLGTIIVRWQMLAATSSSTTFKLRVGGTAGTTTFNGASSGRKYGGVASSSFTVQEIMC